MGQLGDYPFFNLTFLSFLALSLAIVANKSN